jgi:NitT/TauT family transport system permease protein
LSRNYHDFATVDGKDAGTGTASADDGGKLGAAQNFGLTGTQLFRRVILPATLPQIITGLRIALGVAWLVVVAAEMIAVNSGLGYLIIDARNAGRRYDLVVAGMVLIGFIGWLLDLLMRQVERLQAMKWAYGIRND